MFDRLLTYLDQPLKFQFVYFLLFSVLVAPMTQCWKKCRKITCFEKKERITEYLKFIHSDDSHFTIRTSSASGKAVFMATFSCLPDGGSAQQENWIAVGEEAYCIFVMELRDS